MFNHLKTREHWTSIFRFLFRALYTAQRRLPSLPTSLAMKGRVLSTNICTNVASLPRSLQVPCLLETAALFSSWTFLWQRTVLVGPKLFFFIHYNYSIYAIQFITTLSLRLYGSILSSWKSSLHLRRSLCPTLRSTGHWVKSTSNSRVKRPQSPSRRLSPYAWINATQQRMCFVAHISTQSIPLTLSKKSWTHSAPKTRGYSWLPNPLKPLACKGNGFRKNGTEQITCTALWEVRLRYVSTLALHENAYMIPRRLYPKNKSPNYTYQITTILSQATCE